MTKPLELSKEADNELTAAVSEYNKIAPRFALDFIADLEEVLRNIAEFPEMYQVVRRTVRRAVLIGFPYSVIYRISPNAIRVIAVLHSHSDPDRITRRTDDDPSK